GDRTLPPGCYPPCTTMDHEPTVRICFMDERPVVFSLYGIRTRGAWQKAALNLVLTEGGFTHIPLDYGHFALWRFLLPSARQKKIEEFLQEYTTYTEQTISTHPGGLRTSVITHSFGTYIVAAALLRYPEIRFDNIIFCGSIVRSDFPW